MQHCGKFLEAVIAADRVYANESLTRLASFGPSVRGNKEGGPMEMQLPQAPAPMTHYEVALEYGRALTDPEHPMYRYRYTEKFNEWADALFARIPRSR
jgi:hypothetical protein